MFWWSGEVANVSSTAYDFRCATLLGERIPRVFGAPGVSGFDVNYCLSPSVGDTPAATLVHRDSGRVLQVFTDQPGLQLYTGNHLDGIPGKLGAKYTQHSSVALETQNYPDAVHHVSCTFMFISSSSSSISDAGCSLVVCDKCLQFSSDTLLRQLHWLRLRNDL